LQKAEGAILQGIEMTPQEFTQYLNLAKILDLLTSGHQVGGVFYVYDSSGHRRTLESFIADYPLERLQAMVARMRSSL
jgi:hypothetical protein